MTRILAFALALALFGGHALAQDIKAGDLVIEKPWARATPKGAEVGGAYLTIRNTGAAADRLTGGTADFATIQVHEMTMAGGVMKMRELPDGLAIPAHGSVTLSPGGYHIMFVGLKQPLTKGSTAKVTLTFEHAGAVAVEFPIGGIGAAGPDDPKKGEKKGEMKGMKM
jgi:hypothetical protein